MVSKGSPATGVKRAVDRNAPKVPGKLYRFEGHLTGYSLIPDSVFEAGIALLFSVPLPITLTYASIDETGNVVIEGRA